MFDRVNEFFNILFSWYRIPLKLILKISYLNDKVQLLSNVIYCVIFLHFLINVVAAYDTLNHKRLNFVNGIMRESTTVLYRPIGVICNVRIFDKFARKFKSFRKWMYLCWIDGFSIENFNLSVFLWAHFSMMNLPTNVVVLLSCNL